MSACSSDYSWDSSAHKRCVSVDAFRAAHRIYGAKPLSSYAPLGASRAVKYGGLGPVSPAIRPPRHGDL